MKLVKLLLSGIDLINRWIGEGLHFPVVLLLALLTFVEVIMRYVFNSPTVWSRDVTLQLQGLILALGAGYALLYDAHVRVDVLVVRLSPRKRAIVDLCSSLFFFFAIGIFVWLAVKYAGQSVEMRERFSSIWMPPIYPLKVVIAIGGVLLLLQGLAKFIRDFIVVFSPDKRG